MIIMEHKQIQTNDNDIHSTTIIERNQDEGDDHYGVNIKDLIDSPGSCGRFQYITIFFISWVKILGSMSAMLMAFGNYNPGWQCLEDSESGVSNGTNSSLADLIRSLNDTDKCDLFKRCNNVQFTPGISTVVTEWHLICDKAWISSIIISVQMIGTLVGGIFCGYIGDKYGRKRTICAGLMLNMVSHVISMFSNSWEMFAVMRFVIGIANPFILYTPVLLAMEFVYYKWRNVVICFPAWPIGCVCFVLSAMATENWRYIQGVNAAASFICLIPFYWVPESLRWMLVKDKTKDAFALVKTIVRLNKIADKGIDTIHDIGIENRLSQPDSRNSSIFQLLRKGVRYPTFVVGVVCMCMSLIFFAISFGVKSLPGNLYTNLLIMFACEIAIAPISSIIPNYIGRKLSIIIFLFICTLCLFITACLDLSADGSLKLIGSLVCVIIARTTGDCAWDITVTYIGELFPTVIRSTSVSYACWISRIGGILAPYLISDDPDSYFISYFIMASCVFVSCVLVVFLPSTKGNNLTDVWEVSVQDPMLNEKSMNEDETKEQ